MKRLFAKGASLSRIWIALGASLLVVAALLLVLALLQPGSAAPQPQEPTDTAQPTTAVPASPTPEPSPTPTAVPVVASVNNYTITEPYLDRATALNQVLSEFAGQEPLGASETLQRLIKQQLVLQGAAPENEPTEAEVEDYIVRMQEAWDIDEETMTAELAAAGVERAFLEETIQRLLNVQAATQLLTQQGHDVNEWLSEQEKEADIRIREDLAELTSIEPTKPQPSPTPSPTKEIATRPPTATPIPAPTIPDVASDFTLDQAGGGTFTLSQQLEAGPVVLVFFQRCG